MDRTISASNRVVTLAYAEKNCVEPNHILDSAGKILANILPEAWIYVVKRSSVSTV